MSKEVPLLKPLASVVLLFLFAAVMVPAAQADLMTSSAGYSGPVLNLSGYADGQYHFTFGPVSLPGGITFTGNPGGGGNSGQGSVIGQGHYGLGSNGNFELPAVYVGLDSATGFMTFAFSSPVSSFGGFMNYCPECGGSDPTISAFDSSMNLLESFDLFASAPISTPGGLNQFAFRGISRQSADIAYFQMSGDYIIVTGTENGAPIPEPTTLMLFGSGLVGLAGAARRKLIG